jgi:Ca2+-binding EF-hand superfamily protein
MQTMQKLGHGDVPRETVLSILREVDAHPDGKVDLHEFLDVA